MRRMHQSSQALPSRETGSKDPLHRLHFIVPLVQQDVHLPQGSSPVHLATGSHKHRWLLWFRKMLGAASASTVPSHEVWHFPETCKGLFQDYVNTWLKIKQEASGWPRWVGDDKTKLQQYIR